MPQDKVGRQAEITWARLWPRVEAMFAPDAPADEWAAFERRLARYFPRLFRLLMALYGSQYDFYYHLERILSMAARMWLERSSELKALDAEREADPL